MKLTGSSAGFRLWGFCGYAKRRLSWLAVLSVICAIIATADRARAGEYRFDEIRPYLGIRVGQSYFTDPHAPAIVALESPSVHPTYGVSLGADIGHYFGLEIAGDYVKTELKRAAGGGQLGDYSLATLAALARLRYPLLDSRLVPYILAGAGYGLGEFSGREDFTFTGGGSDTTGFGVVGVGAEYFVAENIALGFEAKHFFAFNPEIRTGPGSEDLTADSVAVTAHTRIYLDRLGGLRDPASGPREAPKDSDQLRGYVALRAGTGFFTAGGSGGGLNIDTHSGVLGAGAIGLNFNKYFGAELASEYTRAQLRSPTLGRVAGYPIWTVLAQARARYPLLDDRLVPYLVAGGGLGIALGGGDKDAPFAVTGFTGNGETTYVGAVGLGLEFFLEDNLAVGVEAKHTFLFDSDVTFLGRPASLDLDFVSLTAGIRLLFP